MYTSLTLLSDIISISSSLVLFQRHGNSGDKGEMGVFNIRDGTAKGRTWLGQCLAVICLAEMGWLLDWIIV